ncbi:MAG: hypothetical protein IJ717_00860 [Treponema sp.]|nr:hypothetical protein [Treponema sp.]
MKKVWSILFFTFFAIAIFVACEDTSDSVTINYIVDNKFDEEIIMSDGVNSYSVPANSRETISIDYDSKQNRPELSVISDLSNNFQRVKCTKSRNIYTIEKKDAIEFLIVNTGNCTIKISGNYLGETFGESINIEKQSKTSAIFFDNASSCIVEYVDDFAKSASPFFNIDSKNHVITVF